MKKYLKNRGRAALLVGLFAIMFVLAIFRGFNFSGNLFPWQQDKYCSFEDEIVTFKTRCSFDVVTSFEDGDPSNPEFYVRQNDGDWGVVDGGDLLSTVDVSMHRRHEPFPVSFDDISAYWKDMTRYRKQQIPVEIKPFMMNGRKGWRITENIDDDIGKYGHFSSIMESFFIENDEKSMYIVGVLIATDSLRKRDAYAREADYIVNSIVWTEPTIDQEKQLVPKKVYENIK